MVVNSLAFFVFFLVVFVIYYLPVWKTNSRFQNYWLLTCSLFFYGFADWRMIPLLIGETFVMWEIGNRIKRAIRQGKEKKASRLTTFGVLVGVGVLLYYKYLDFFALSFASVLSSIGLNVSWTTLHLVLPLGVSFYTFKLVSYVIEIHREHIEPDKDFGEFASYVSFFPTILSGPIDRPNTFIPQMKVRRIFNYDMAVEGCWMVLWGMFTKMVIADNLALITDTIWSSYDNFTASSIVMAALLYPLQMYTDFAGYSNMAIGVGCLLGFKVTQNFNYPFFARNVAEYWRRWHMSLTSWITDYVFTPLNVAFRDWENWGIISAVIINLVVIGFWHGANWTYGLFGLYHGLLFVPLVFSGTFAKRKKLKPGKTGFAKGSDFLKMIETYLLVAIGLIIFRSPDVAIAFDFIGHMFSMSILQSPMVSLYTYQALIGLVFLLIHDNLSVYKPNLLVKNSSSSLIKYAYVLLLTFLIGTIGIMDSAQFIYIKF